MSRKISFLVNPISGNTKKDDILKFIHAELQGKDLEFEFLFTNANGNYDDIVDRIARDGITDIVMIGGDGTVNQVVNALRDQPVQFGIIPLGSGNGLALAAGIPKKPQEAISLILKGEAKPVDAFMVNDQFSCMLSGIGFDAQVAHDFASKASRGLMTYTQQSLINYFKAQPYQFEIVLENFSFFTDAYFISIANGNQFGNNVTIAPKANLNDGLLDVVVVQKMNKVKMPFAVLKQIRGNNKLMDLVENMEKNNILYFQTSALSIRNLKYAPFHIDGEPVETAAEFNIKIIPSCFQLIQP
ncbi:MAG: diacylglycerol kinase [Bacteroidetes bacterium 24-39-8]|jgi:YegS/Rv2252/BmrU family lipid kinase|nr:MAG: diacylglycerol kinase [Bacteroidetes bacterium 24-39-8]OZA67154.1 MAG: diacylglycerol kinase [Sphingobacteriia bacterium 39-39-8]HQR93817.1 YegS/Rv2252/BmrU family lipid kinase [Sediminibacterium sp.]HQS54263.1 YegS/Rv2252/BmrU family lipid kinase [Sediminibacterium sp.]